MQLTAQSDSNMATKYPVPKRWRQIVPALSNPGTETVSTKMAAPKWWRPNVAYQRIILPTELHKLLYKSLFHSQLEPAAAVWTP